MFMNYRKPGNDALSSNSRLLGCIRLGRCACLNLSLAIPIVDREQLLDKTYAEAR